MINLLIHIGTVLYVILFIILIIIISTEKNFIKQIKSLELKIKEERDKGKDLVEVHFEVIKNSENRKRINNMVFLSLFAIAIAYISLLFL